MKTKFDGYPVRLVEGSLDALADEVLEKLGDDVYEEIKDEVVEDLSDILDAKADSDAYAPQFLAGAAESLTGNDAQVSTWARRTSERDGAARIESLRGNTVVWNQLINYSTTSTRFTVGDDGVITVTDTSTTSMYFGKEVLQHVNGHKYLFIGRVIANPNNVSFTFGVGGGATWITGVQALGEYSLIYTSTDSEWPDIHNISANPSGLKFLAQTFDLTLMFGAGNEPSTVAEFEAMFPDSYYPYDPGSLLSVNVEGVKSVGRNLLDTSILFDSSWQNPTGSNYWRVRTYNLEPNTTYTLSVNCGTGASNGPFSLSSALDVSEISRVAYLGHPITVTSGADGVIYLWKRIAGGSYIPTAENIGNGTITAQLERGSITTSYQPYRESVREIPASTYFPSGMKSAGSVYDELTATKAVNRVGAVTFDGSETWRVKTQGGSTFYVRLKGMVHRQDYSNALICDKMASDMNHNNIANMAIAGYYDIIGSYQSENWLYARNDSFTSVNDFTNWLSQNPITVQYELATPATQPIDPPLNLTYKTERGGTEQIVVPTGEQSAPPTMAIMYGYTAEGLRDETQSIIAPVEHGVASANYAVGSYLIMGGKLYKVTVATAIGENIVPGTNVTETTVMAEIANLIS